MHSHCRVVKGGRFLLASSVSVGRRVFHLIKSALGGSKNIHAYTIGTFLEFHEQGGFFELEIQRHGGYLQLKFWRHREFSRGDRQECESTNKLMTLLMTMQSRIQVRHRLIRYVFAFIWHKKTDKKWVAHQAQEALKLINFFPRLTV